MSYKKKWFVSPVLKLNPFWFCFLFFFGSNIFLAYGHQNIETNLFIIFYGFLVPIFIFILFRNRISFLKSDEKQKDFVFFGPNLPDPPIYIWISFFFLLLATRFYGLDTI